MKGSWDNSIQVEQGTQTGSQITNTKTDIGKDFLSLLNFFVLAQNVELSDMKKANKDIKRSQQRNENSQ